VRSLANLPAWQWSEVVGAEDFGRMCATMQRLLDALAPDESRR
jgi:hypothetical protein